MNRLTGQGPRGDSVRAQHDVIGHALVMLGYTTREARLKRVSELAGRPIAAFAALGFVEASHILLDLSSELANPGRPAAPPARPACQ